MVARKRRKKKGESHPRVLVLDDRNRYLIGWALGLALDHLWNTLPRRPVSADEIAENLADLDGMKKLRELIRHK